MALTHWLTLTHSHTHFTHSHTHTHSLTHTCHTLTHTALTHSHTHTHTHTHCTALCKWMANLVLQHHSLLGQQHSAHTPWFDSSQQYTQLLVAAVLLLLLLALTHLLAAAGSSSSVGQLHSYTMRTSYWLITHSNTHISLASVDHHFPTLRSVDL